MAKAALYARSESDLLVRLVRSALERVWLETIGLDESMLTDAQRIDMSIIFGGIVSAMADTRIQPGPDLFASVLSRPLGRGMLKTLVSMKRPAASD